MEVPVRHLLVGLDGDLTGWGTHFVTDLIGPLLLASAQVRLVKVVLRPDHGQMTSAHTLPRVVD